MRAFVGPVGEAMIPRIRITIGQFGLAFQLVAGARNQQMAAIRTIYSEHWVHMRDEGCAAVTLYINMAAQSNIRSSYVRLVREQIIRQNGAVAR